MSSMLEVTGIAYPGGSGETIQQGEVSADEGRSWQLASLRNDEVLPDQSSKNWHWVRWHANLDVREGTVAGEVWCRASTSSEQQPRVSPKRGGYVYSGWHSHAWGGCASSGVAA